MTGQPQARTALSPGPVLVPPEVLLPAYVRILNQAMFRAYIDVHADSQMQLAIDCGLSSQRMSQLVTGVGPVIRASSALRITATLRVPPWLLFGPDEPELIAQFLPPDVHAALPGGALCP
jgi:hypothetical protein